MNPVYFLQKVEKWRGCPLISSKSQHCVEQLCAEGCRSVRLCITRLEQGEDVSQTDELKPEEKQQVLAELKAIMAVYDK